MFVIIIIMYIIKYDSYNYLILWGGFSRYQSDWAKQVSIPTRFSAETTSALKNKVTTQKARDEIINALAALILVHTLHPTSDDYNMVCQRLVNKHPSLKDASGSGYVGFLLYIIYTYNYIYIIQLYKYMQLCSSFYISHNSPLNNICVF